MEFAEAISATLLGCSTKPGQWWITAKYLYNSSIQLIILKARRITLFTVSPRNLNWGDHTPRTPLGLITCFMPFLCRGRTLYRQYPVVQVKPESLYLRQVHLPLETDPGRCIYEMPLCLTTSLGIEFLLPRRDLNPASSGYEPDMLPLHHRALIQYKPQEDESLSIGFILLPTPL